MTRFLKEKCHWFSDTFSKRKMPQIQWHFLLAKCGRLSYKKYHWFSGTVYNINVTDLETFCFKESVEKFDHKKFHWSVRNISNSAKRFLKGKFGWMSYKKNITDSVLLFITKLLLIQWHFVYEKNDTFSIRKMLLTQWHFL